MAVSASSSHLSEFPAPGILKYVILVQVISVYEMISVTGLVSVGRRYPLSPSARRSTYTVLFGLSTHGFKKNVPASVHKNTFLPAAAACMIRTMRCLAAKGRLV